VDEVLIYKKQIQ